MAKPRPKPAPTTTSPTVIPAKPYFKIGEVARILGVATSALRFWETEFPSVRPTKSRTGQRVYERRHVERLLAIRTLVHEQGYTLAGAKKQLREGGAAEVLAAAEAARPAPAAAAAGGLDRAAREKALAVVRELLQLCDE